MWKLNIPYKTIQAFGYNRPFADNINLLLNRYLINHESIEKAKKELFMYLSKEIRAGVLNLNKILETINSKMSLLSDIKIKLGTSSRLIVGLGSTSVLETSIKLHHIYGVPYIPSSAVKGTLRAYKMWVLSDWDTDLLRAFEIAVSKIYEKCNDPEKEFTEKLQKIDEKNLKQEDKILIEKKDEIIRKQDQFFSVLSIFGSQSIKGSLTIFDAYPDSFKGFDIDVMNPHYPDYYQGNEPPADWQNPNPIKFLAIPEGTIFNFYFSNPYKDLETDLKDALQIVGIGAKTALGYGSFKP